MDWYFNSIPCTFSLICGPSKQTRWAVDKAMYLKMNNHSLWDQWQWVILLLLLLGETERYICTCPPSDDMGNWERLFSIPLSLWYFYDGSVYLWYICAWPRSKRGGVTTLLFSFLMAASVTWALDLIRKKYLLSWSTGSNELPLFRNNNTVYLGAWLNLMFVTLASVSKPANSQWHYQKYWGDYGTPTIITLLANQHLFWLRIFHCWGVVAQIFSMEARENLSFHLLKKIPCL